MKLVSTWHLVQYRNPPTCCDVLNNLSLLFIVLGFSQVSLVKIAALHGSEPRHSCLIQVDSTAPEKTNDYKSKNSSQGSRVICILDDPVTFPAPIRSIIPAKVRVASRHRRGLLHLRPAVKLWKVPEYLSKFLIRINLPFKENTKKTRNKCFILLSLLRRKMMFVAFICSSYELIFICKDILENVDIVILS